MEAQGLGYMSVDSAFIYKAFAVHMVRSLQMVLTLRSRLLSLGIMLLYDSFVICLICNIISAKYGDESQ